MTEFTREDVEHLDVLIAQEVKRGGIIALPGAEHVRNKIAKEVGLEEQPEGGITWDFIRETSYSTKENTA